MIHVINAIQSWLRAITPLISSDWACTVLVCITLRSENVRVPLHHVSRCQFDSIDCIAGGTGRLRLTFRDVEVSTPVSRHVQMTVDGLGLSLDNIQIRSITMISCCNMFHITNRLKLNSAVDGVRYEKFIWHYSNGQLGGYIYKQSWKCHQFTPRAVFI